MMNNFDQWAETQRQFFQECFEARIADLCHLAPKELQEAIAYVISNHGKGIRPLLTFASAHACGVDRDEVLPLAMAIEPN